jgi:hypothetical protein
MQVDFKLFSRKQLRRNPLRHHQRREMWLKAYGEPALMMRQIIAKEPRAAKVVSYGLK